MRYRTIVADPPWDVKRGPDWGSGGKSRDLPYPTMSVDEIAALPVTSLAAESAHLYVWTINAYVEQTYGIVRAWGFRPVVLLTWAKEPHGLGLGGTFIQTTEHILFARRGICPAASRVDTTWWLWKRGEHSAKPEAFMDIVEQVSPAPRLEMFSRRARLGWDTWGNEALGGMDLLGEAAWS